MINTIIMIMGYIMLHAWTMIYNCLQLSIYMYSDDAAKLVFDVYYNYILIINIIWLIL